MANISANKISLPQGQSYTEGEKNTVFTAGETGLEPDWNERVWNKIFPDFSLSVLEGSYNLTKTSVLSVFFRLLTRYAMTSTNCYTLTWLG